MQVREGGRIMKIALISSNLLPVPPSGYGGAEQVIWDLVCSLIEMGHKVVLFAPNQSKVPPNGFLVETGSAPEKVHVDWRGLEKQAYEKYKGMLQDFDIIHSQSWFHFPYLAKNADHTIRVCATHHGHLNFKTKPPGVEKMNLIAISRFMAEQYSLTLGVHVHWVYNGIDLARYPFKKNHGDRLLYVGRFAEYKQPHVAIEVAKRLKMPLDVCLLPNQEVFVDSILKPVDNIVVGEQVYTHNGRFRAVQHVIARYYEGKLVRLRVHNLPFIVSVTPDHPILAAKAFRYPSGKIKRTFGGKHTRIRYSLKWIKADELVHGDFVAIPIPDEKEVSQISLVGDYDFDKEGTLYSRGTFQGHHWVPRSMRISSIITIDEAFLKLIGYYVAEGSSSGGGIAFNLGPSETVLSTEIQELIQTVFGLTPREIYLPNKSTRRVYVNSRALDRWFPKNFGKNALNKRLPSWVFGISVAGIRTLLKAMWKGDGCITNRGKYPTLNYSTASRTLAYQLFLLLAKIGVVANVSAFKRKVSFGKSMRYTVTVNAPYIQALFSEVKSNTQTPKRLVEIQGNYIICPIWKKTKEDYKGQVYNLKVVSDNSFVPIIATHNCGGTFVEKREYVEQLKVECGKNNFGFYPDAPHEVKMRLLRKAKALLFPSRMGEPFGLCAVEAMSCGTPVVATNDGAIGEIVQDGLTGFVCNVYEYSRGADGRLHLNVKRDPVEAMCEAVKKVDSISPKACRRLVEDNFTRGIMARRYEKNYKEVLEGREW